ncbi:protein containing DUF1589 [Rhodopirellula baltica SH28]|uniref:Protein containing DUF1589 n=1 Tax=Rhodopirellula baltica SH28 TaxID=993517 RepID=K5EB91_RHOBT|nr:DUF1589 domain-containing protein [Rhodopirellula baltica]EKK03101.1 protein containing DUF1589 [Rhodopirellula baltica SH28]
MITWHPTDALEQSEASSPPRKNQHGPSNHPARYNLAYDAPVTPAALARPPQP